MRSRHGFDFDLNTAKNPNNNMGCVLFIIIVVAVVGLLIVSACGGLFPNYSDGERTGTVTKISKKGWVMKSYEGSMNVGGMAADSDGVMVPVVWEFSVKDPEVAKAIQAAAERAERATLHYHEYGIKPISVSTGYVVDGVKVGSEWIIKPPAQ